MTEGVRTPGAGLLTVTKADARSTVHRRAWLDLVAVTLPAENGKPRQHRLVGLFPTTAAAASVREVPLLRRRAADLLARSGVPADSHTGSALLDVLETYPREELFQVGTDELLPVAMAVLYLQERRQTRLFLRRDPAGRFWSALVYLPRDRYTTEVRTRMQQLLLERLGGSSIEYTARSTESVLARLHFVVRMPVAARGTPRSPDVDVEALQTELAGAARSWTDELSDALSARYGADAERMLARVADAFPAAYQEDFPADRAVSDLDRLESQADGEIGLRFWTPADALPGERRLTVYRVGTRLLLSDVLPVLQHMGVDVVDERPYEIDRIGAPPAWIYDFGLTVSSVAGPSAELPLVRSLPERFTEALSAVWRGEAEDDGLGALVLLAGLHWRQVTVVRAYVQWLRQTGLPFGQAYVEQTLAAHPGIVARLVALFETRFSPDAARRARRAAGRPGRLAARGRSARWPAWTPTGCSAPCSPRSLATQRTTYYADGPLAIKLAPAEVPDVPEPRPAREIWVSSPRVDGRPPALRRGRPRWPALVRPAGGPAHRGARAGQGADGEEHRHRAHRRQGRVRRQAPAAGERRPRRGPGRGPGLLPDLHRRAARAHRQPGRRRASSRRSGWSGTTATTPTWSSPPTRGRRPSPTWPTPSRLERGFWLGDAFASRRLGRLRPQGDGHHRPRRVGVGDPALPRAGPRRRRPRTSPSSGSATCPATCSATGCCCPSTSGWWPPSTTGTSSSTRPRRRRVLRRAAAAVRAAPLLVGRLRPLADLRGRRRVAAHGQVGAGHARRCARRSAWPTTSSTLTPVELIARDPAGAGRPAVQRRHRHLRQGVGGEQRRGRGQGQRRPAGGRRPAAGARGGRGRQPRAHPARARRVRARRRQGEHRRDRQLRRCGHLRPRGQHQDRAVARGRGGPARRRAPGRAAAGDGRRRRRRRPDRQPRAERDAGRRGGLRAQPARRARSGSSGPWSAAAGWCAASRTCPTTGRWASGGATGRR